MSDLLQRYRQEVRTFMTTIAEQHGKRIGAIFENGWNSSIQGKAQLLPAERTVAEAANNGSLLDIFRPDQDVTPAIAE